ncbi:ABC transporter permease subunit [Lysinibacillus sp. NPDC058147]|uniref:ABC transporter permease subunit n=1 Tax=unclassified Lysinibacillus TaxID=2636778 RepID=UPI0036DF7309
MIKLHKRLNGKQLISIALLSFIGLLGLFAPFIMPNDPFLVDVSKKFLGPSWAYPFGTDHLGRCILSRILLGIRYSLGSALFIQLIASFFAICIGAIVAFKRGIIDYLFIRICDILLAFPTLVLAFGLLGILGPSLRNVLLALIFTQTIYYSRILRGLFISVNEKEFIKAAKISGTSGVKLIQRHFAPNIMAPMLTIISLDLGKVILEIAGFSFIGLGVQAPTPEWGMMISEGKQHIRQHPELMLYPGTAIIIVVLLFNILSSRNKQVDH